MPFADVLTGSYAEYSSDIAPSANAPQASDDPTSPGANPLGLGPVFLTTAEHPEELSFGLTQAQATHRAVGGSVYIQTLGPQPKDVEWEGIFRGPTVLARSRLLKRLCAQGQVIPLTYIDESYDVLILEIDIKYKWVGRADYRILVRILRDTSGGYAKASAPSIDTQTLALYNMAQGSVASLVAVDPDADGILSAPVNALGVQLQQAGPLASLTGEKATALMQSISKAVASAQHYAQIVGLGTQWGQISGALSLTSTLQCIAKNAQNGQAPRTDTIFGSDFWDLSSKWYGTPEYAQALASINGRQTPRVAPGELLSVIIPPLASMSREH